MANGVSCEDENIYDEEVENGEIEKEEVVVENHDGEVEGDRVGVGDGEVEGDHVGVGDDKPNALGDHGVDILIVHFHH